MRHIMEGKYGRWTVIEYSHKTKNRVLYWKCVCECGTIRSVRGSSLRNGKSKSCGCLQKEEASKTQKGKIVSDETRVRLSKTLTGRVFTDEWRKKMSESKKGKYRGEDSPHWKSNLTDKDRKYSRLVSACSNWRKDVFERDNYTCQRCEKRGGELHSHHIYLWSKFESLRFEEWNGMTLCVDCHRWVHSNKNINEDYMEVN